MINNTMLKEFDVLRREMETLFNGFASRPLTGSPVARLFGSRDASYPAIRLHDDQDAFYVEAALPGVEPDSVDVSVHQKVLILSGEKPRLVGENGPEVFRRKERPAGKFARRIVLPDEVDVDQISATYTNGMLVITLPRAEEAKPKQINVNAA